MEVESEKPMLKTPSWLPPTPWIFPSEVGEEKFSMKPVESEGGPFTGDDLPTVLH